MFRLSKMVLRSGVVVLAALVMILGSSLAPAQVLAATAPTLGAAGSFAVLAGSGITNTGPTTINGDVGTFPTTSETGFGSVTLTGTDHAGDAVTQQAKIDLVTAYNSLASQSSTSDLTGQDLGGLELTPGVYTFSTSAQLTGQLTLNAQNNPDAVFIFQIGSTLTTASNSSVVVINEPGNWCNKYWQVGSSATLGTGTHFQGNILALTSITLNTGAHIIYGRALARNGAVTMDTNTITIPVCATTTTTQLSVDSIISGGSVTDTVTVTGIGYPAGPVDFQVSTDGISFNSFDATQTLNEHGNAISDPYTTGSPGIYYFRAIYGGATYYAGSQSGDLDEPLVVTDSEKATSTTATLLSYDSITLGGNVTDTAHVDGINPTGTVIFQVSTDGGTTFTTYGATQTLDGSGNATSDTYTPTSIGTSYFRAIYSGDQINNGSTSGNTAEPLITAAVQGAHLSLTKVVSPSVFSHVGDILYYTLVATNDGTTTLHNVSISDLGLDNIESNPVQPATLEPGETLTVTGTHTITHGDLYTGHFDNTATATSNEAESVTVTEESSRAPSVGREVGTINKARILAPWLGLGLVLVLGGTVLTRLLLRRRISR